MRSICPTQLRDRILIKTIAGLKNNLKSIQKLNIIVKYFCIININTRTIRL